MATAAADGFTSSRKRALTIAPALAVAAFASIGAGVIHAAAIGVHSEHRQAVITFTAVAAVQIEWGVIALLYAKRWFILAGAVANAAIFGGWVLTKTDACTANASIRNACESYTTP